MILTCPQCASRYQADEAKLPPAGRAVRCGKCRHTWHQPGFEIEPEPIAPRSGFAPRSKIAWAVQSAVAVTSRNDEIAPGQTQFRATDGGQPKPFRLAVIALAVGWVSVLIILLLVALLINHYRLNIAMTAPRSAFVQPLASHEMDMLGVDLRNVGYIREIDDGQTMLVITGTIANGANRALPVPKTIRVMLSDANGSALFSAAISPTVATLVPGQSVTFQTKIHDLPSINPHLQMRLED
jgi:predicted Zn finger-like uncharacterized protein